MNTSDILLSVIICIIFILLNLAPILSVGLQNVQQNWVKYRCNPIVIPFAGLFGENPSETFNFCVQNMVKELMKFPIGRKCIHGAVKKRIWNKKYNVQNSSFLDEIHQGRVSFEYLNYLYSNLGLSLGVTELWDTYTLSEPIHKIHLRTFEIPMCGGLQIAPYSKELSGYFEENKEIIFFENEMDLVEKSKFYLSDRNSQVRKEMKIKARIRAENDHSWSSRFKQLHDEIF